MVEPPEATDLQRAMLDDLGMVDIPQLDGSHLFGHEDFEDWFAQWPAMAGTGEISCETAEALTYSMSLWRWEGPSDRME